MNLEQVRESGLILRPRSTGYRSREACKFDKNNASSRQTESAQWQGGPEETLVVDQRARLRPAQWVEQKFFSVLRSVLLPVSQVDRRSLGRGRGPRCSNKSSSSRIA